MMPCECTIITEECVIDMNREKDLLAKRGAPTGGWKGGILIIDHAKYSNGGNVRPNGAGIWFEKTVGEK